MAARGGEAVSGGQHYGWAGPGEELVLSAMLKT